MADGIVEEMTGEPAESLIYSAPVVVQGVTVVEDTKGRVVVGAPLTALTKPRQIPKPSAVSQAPHVSTDRRIRGTPYRRDDDTNRPFIVLINPSSPSASQIIDGTKFDSFIMMAFREEDQEKAMISETFGAPHILGTGRMVRRMTFSGTLRTTPTWASVTPPPLVVPMADNSVMMAPQYLILLEFYNKWLRLSEQLSRGIMTRIVIDQQFFDGYVLNLTSGRDSSSQSFGDFSFSFVCLNQGVINALYRQGLYAFNNRFAGALASTAKVSAADKKGELVAAENKIKLKLFATKVELTREDQNEYDLQASGQPVTLTVIEGNNGRVETKIEAGDVTGIRVVAKEDGGAFPREMQKGIPLALRVTLPPGVPVSTIRITFGGSEVLTITVKSTTEVAYVEKEESPVFALQGSPGENYVILGTNAVGKALTPGQMAADIPFTFSVSYRHSGSNALVQPSELLKDELLATFQVVPVPLASIIKTGAVPAVVAKDQEIFSSTTTASLFMSTAVAEGDKIVVSSILRVIGIPDPAPSNRNGATGLQFQFSYEPSKGVANYQVSQGKVAKPVQFVVAGDLKWDAKIGVIAGAIMQPDVSSVERVQQGLLERVKIGTLPMLLQIGQLGDANPTPTPPADVKWAALKTGLKVDIDAGCFPGPVTDLEGKRVMHMFVDETKPFRYYTLQPLPNFPSVLIQLSFYLAVGKLSDGNSGILLSIMSEPEDPSRVRDLPPAQQRELAAALVLAVQAIKVLTVYPDPAGAYPAEDNSVTIRR